jgi:hypothetical protein
MPEPMPRPTRFFFSVDFFGARIVDKFIWIPCFKVSRFQGFKVSRFQGFKEKPITASFYFETLPP